jgi:elongation factor G
LEDDVISNEELVAVLRECVKRGEVVPVLVGAMTSEKGAIQLLDAIVDYFPSPAERPATIQSNGSVEPLPVSPDGPLAALVFKTIADPHVGRLSYFKVYSGTLSSNGQALNATAGKSERVGQLFYVRGKEHINTDSVQAGDIAAVGKLNATHTGETLCAEGLTLSLDGIEFPPVSYSAAVNPKTKADLDKLGQGLGRMIEEDPTLQISRDTVTGETILSGLGEPHIQIALERMTRRYGINVDVGLPRVQYRETISSKTNSEYKHKKQTGGAGQYGHVLLELEPLPDGDFEFADRVVGGSVPKNYFPAVEKGIREALEAGPLAGYPVVNIKATLYDGSYHDVDSNEMAFKIAAKEAFKKGILQAQPVLLEPVLTIHVTIPDQFTGDVMSDLNAKRAQVNGMTPTDDGLRTTIDAVVPAAEVQRYATDLRSITQGRGSFSTEFSHYQPVPMHLAEQIKAEAKQHEGTAA